MLRRCGSDEECSPGECPGSHIVYINDMSAIQECYIKIFADDTKVYTAMQSDKHTSCFKMALISWCSGKRTDRSDSVMINVKLYMLGRIIQSTNILWMAWNLNV